MYIVETYLVYLAVSVAITIWVARTLHRGGRPFLVDAFHGQETLADSVNHLLVVGFYLVNLGWVVATLRTRLPVDTARGAIEMLSDKIGTVLLVLGAMHFLNIYLFSQLRRRALDRLATAAPPLPPSGMLSPHGGSR